MDESEFHQDTDAGIIGFPQRTPRIVHDPEDSTYDYFAYDAKDRLADLNKQITEREKKLFELEVICIGLDGAPEDPGVITHDNFATLIEQRREGAEKDGKKYVPDAVCPCNACQLDRLDTAVKGMTYSLRRLRVLAAKLTGGS